MNLVLFGILIYVLVQILIGFYVARRIRTEDDYLLAGRKLGYILATFSIFATWFGAESCIGSAGVAYEEGAAGISAEPFGYGITLLLAGVILAVPLWRLKLSTVADVFRLRYSPSIEKLVAIIIIPTSIFWAAAQIRAFGLVLSASAGMDVTLMITVAAAVVIVYTISGGLMADAITDIIQGIVIIVGLFVIFFGVVNHTGGFTALFDTITADGVLFRPTTDHEGAWGILTTMETWAIPIVGSMLAQELISRMLGSRSAKVAKRSTLVASGAYVFIGFVPLVIGLIGMRLFPELEYSEQILPMVAQHQLTQFFYIIFAGGLVSAILSTVDSALLAASGILIHNVVLPMRRVEEERMKVRLQRWGVALMGILAYFLAIYAEGIYNLVKDASAFGSAGVFVVFFFGLFSRFGGVRSAAATLISGAFVWLVAYYVFDFELSFILSVVVSLVIYVLFASVEKNSLSLKERIREAEA